MAWSNTTGWTTGSGGWNRAAVSGSPVLFTYDFVANPSLPSGLSLTRTTAGTSIDTSGIRQSATFNVARFDSDWDGISAFTNRGLLIEESRVNRVPSDSDLPIGLYTNVSNCAWSTSATPGADNSTNMATLTSGSGVAYTDTSYATSQPSGLSYFNVDFKKTNWNYVSIDHITASGQSYTGIFDLVNGTFSEGIAQGSFTGSGTIRRLRNSIYKCSIAVNTPGGGFLGIGMAMAATGNSVDSFGHPVLSGMAGTETVLVGSSMASEAPLNYASSHFHVNSPGARGADLLSATGTLATQLTNGPSVWELEDLVTGAITRTQYGNGAFTFPTGKRYRSFGVYPNGTNTAPYTTVGGPY